MNLKQIYQVVDLLHADYQGCKIHLFKDVNSIFKPENEDGNNILGTYFPDTEHINIYQFNMKPEHKELRTAFTLLHELRHHYQNKRNKLDRKYETMLEKDCNLFAWRMYHRHYDSIFNIIINKL